MSLLELSLILLFVVMVALSLYVTRLYDNYRFIKRKYGEFVEEFILKIYCREDVHHVTDEERILMRRSLSLADNYLKNEMNRYYDEKIWVHCFVSLWFDIETVANIKQTGIVGVADNAVFLHKDLSYHYPIILDMKEIRENTLSENHVAGIIVHEYKHHWLKEHIQDSDSDHSESIW